MFLVFTVYSFIVCFFVIQELPIPVFETFSPPELLDRHLQMGGEIHAKQLSKIPLTNQDSINWTHFGGRMGNREQTANLNFHCLDRIK